MIDTITGMRINMIRLQPYQNSIFVFSVIPDLFLAEIDVSGPWVIVGQWFLNRTLQPKSKDVIQFLPETGMVYFSDGSSLVYGSLTNPFSPKVEPQGESILDIGIDPQGEFLYVGGNTSIAVYDRGSMDRLLELDYVEEVGETFSFYGLEATPDGRTVFLNSIYPIRRVAELKIRF